MRGLGADTRAAGGPKGSKQSHKGVPEAESRLPLPLHTLLATGCLNREARRLNRLKSTIAKLSQEDLKNCVELKVAATKARAKAQAKAKAVARPEVEG